MGIFRIFVRIVVIALCGILIGYLSAKKGINSSVDGLEGESSIGFKGMIVALHVLLGMSCVSFISEIMAIVGLSSERDCCLTFQFQYQHQIRTTGPYASMYTFDCCFTIYPIKIVVFFSFLAFAYLAYQSEMDYKEGTCSELAHLSIPKGMNSTHQEKCCGVASFKDFKEKDNYGNIFKDWYEEKPAAVCGIVDSLAPSSSPLASPVSLADGASNERGA